MDNLGATTSLYTQLDPSKREIRLVSSVEVDASGNVSCRLFASQLGENDNQKPQYICLSYLWGDPEQTEPITVNGRRFEATTNLVAFFRHFNSIPVEYRQLPIWIDAICINQADLGEKSIQVRLMGDIYRQAVASIAWIGPHSLSNLFAMTAIGLGAKFIRKADEGSTDWLKQMKNVLCAADIEPSDGEGGLPRNRAWTAITRFLKAPYWTRVWIYQEIVLSINIVLLCGDKTLSIDDLMIFVEWMRSVDLKTGCIHVDPEVFPIVQWPQWLTSMGISRLGKHVLRRRLEHEKPALSPERQKALIELYPIGLSASNPRDHIFGVLGALPLPIVPDYQKSVEDVYVEFASYLIAEGHLHSVLKHRSGSEKHRRKAGLSPIFVLPSWTPDFTLQGFRALSSRRAHVHADSLVTDRNDVWHPKAADVDKPKVDSNTLHVSGIRCENVVEKPELYYYQTAMQNIKKYLPGNTNKNVQLYPSGIPIHQALVRILLKDPGILRDDNDVSQIDLSMVLGLSLWVYVSLLSPEYTKEELFAFWRKIGFELEAPTHEELQIMLFGRRVNDKTGVIMYREDQESYRANYRTAMFQLASWDAEFMFQTANGYIGLCEGVVQAGDLVCVLFGCQEPVVLRPIGDIYEFIGVCYVLGFMEGEALQQVSDGNLQIQTFDIR